MLHQNESTVDVSELDVSKARKLLVEYLHEGMGILAKRKNTNLIVFSEYIEKYGRKQIEKKFNDNVLNIRRGCTNATSFRTLNLYVPVMLAGAEFTASPELTYILAEGKKPTDFIHDLFFNTEVVTIFDDIVAVNAASYYAILKILQAKFSSEDADYIFNYLFSVDAAKMLVSSYSPKVGDRVTCYSSNGFTVPLNPLSYFIQPAKDALQLGDIKCYQNHAEYRVKLPYGLHYAATVICSVDAPIPQYTNFYLQKLVTEDQLCASHQSACVTPKSAWMTEGWARKVVAANGLNRNGHLQIPKDNMPGFKNSLAYRLHAQRILALLAMPRATLGKVATYFVIESKAINAIREAELKSRKQPTSSLLKNIPLQMQLSPTHEVPAARKSIVEDDPEVLQEMKFINFEYGLHCYKCDALTDAIYYFSMSLMYSRCIYHYFARMDGEEMADKNQQVIVQNHAEKMLDAEQQIAIACYNFAAASYEHDPQEEVIPALAEAQEICDGLQLTAPFVENVNTLFFQIKNNRVDVVCLEDKMGSGLSCS